MGAVGRTDFATSGPGNPREHAVACPRAATGIYVNFGYGFHSNDVRGATIAEDPRTHEPVERVTPLVRAKGAELGIRSVFLPLGWEFMHGLRAGVDVFNVLNAKASDVNYYYASRLPGEPAGGVNDIHTHPAEPRTARAFVSYAF